MRISTPAEYEALREDLKMLVARDGFAEVLAALQTIGRTTALQHKEGDRKRGAYLYVSDAIEQAASRARNLKV